jgi:aminopeptidase N
MLLEKNRYGKRPIDVGPVTMGYRVDSTKTGDDVARAVIYAKGAYILHMLEMMYWTPQDKEEPFKRSMQEFVKEYAGKAASTEDFEHVMEETMPKWVDIQDDGKLDWFFDEYVYGTAIPHYEVSSNFTTDANGESAVHFKVTQSGVTKDFLMLVPMYLQMQNGTTVRLFNLELHGDETFERTLKIGKLPSPGKKLLVNYNADVLSD